MPRMTSKISAPNVFFMRLSPFCLLPLSLANCGAHSTTIGTGETMSDQKNPLEMLFHWEQTRPSTRYLVQPVEGQTRTYTFAQAADQVRRMAAALKAMNFEPGARIAISGQVRRMAAA